MPTRCLGLALFVSLACVVPAFAAGPCSISVGGEIRKMTRQQCALKAVEAMGVKEKFLVAEVDADGNARGWNENNTAVVLSFPLPDPAQVLVLVFVVGRDQKEADRLRQAIRAHVLDGPIDPTTPPRIRAKDAPKESPAPPLRWEAASRNTASTTRFFEAAASLVFEKRGYQTSALAKHLVLAARPAGTAGAFVAPGGNALEHTVVVVVGGEEDKECQRLAKDYLGKILHTLYE